jgi:sugar phosphate isomerase/epimerase
MRENKMESLDQSRRNALKLMGLGTLSFATGGFRFNAPSSYKAKIGLQLYTVRKQLDQDFEGTLRKIADIGFLGIEYYPLSENITADRASKAFKNLGLEVFGMHIPMPTVEVRDGVVKLAEAFKCEKVIYPGWPQGDKYKNLEATKRTAESYDEAATFLKSYGLNFGLHNHWWDFEETDGIVPFYYLLEHLHKNVFFEIDTYWVKTGGKDPVKVVGDFGKRAPLLHIKDGPAVKGDSMYKQVPVGEGSLDFPAIVKAGGENTQWMVVEFDEYDKDIFEGIAKSYAYLTKNGLAEGKT